MKKAILIWTILVFFNLKVKSQDAAVSLINTLYQENTINKMVDNYQNYFKQIALSAYKNEMDTNYLRFMNYAIGSVKGILKTMVENDFAPLYKKIFTEDELNELNRFYSSSIGKKYLDKSPEVSKAVQNLMIEKYLPYIKMDLENYLRDKKK